MAIVTVRHDPELTRQTAMEVFHKHFGGRYEVYERGKHANVIAILGSILVLS